MFSTVWETKQQMRKLADECGIRAKESGNITEPPTHVSGYPFVCLASQPRCPVAATKWGHTHPQWDWGPHHRNIIRLTPASSGPCFSWSGLQKILGLLRTPVESQLDQFVTVRFSGFLLLSIYFSSTAEPSIKVWLKVLESRQRTSYQNSVLCNEIPFHIH